MKSSYNLFMENDITNLVNELQIPHPTLSAMKKNAKNSEIIQKSQIVTHIYSLMSRYNQEYTYSDVEDTRLSTAVYTVRFTNQSEWL